MNVGFSTADESFNPCKCFFDSSLVSDDAPADYLFDQVVGAVEDVAAVEFAGDVVVEMDHMGNVTLKEIDKVLGVCRIGGVECHCMSGRSEDRA